MRYLKQELDAFFDYYKKNQKIETIPQDMTSFATNELISLWEKQNETLYHLLGDQLIYKVPIKIENSEEEMIEKLSESEEFDRYIGGVLRFFDYYWSSHSWYSYEERDKILDFYTNAKYYAQNRYTGSTFLVGDFKVQKNCRFFKTAIKLATKISNGLADYIRSASKDVSLILNQRYLEGNLCLSIHPIDYLTASVNECGWSSCYNPFNSTGNNFRATIAYMMNPYTVIAYLESHKPMHLGELEVSNKKWRNFFYIDGDVLVGVHGYPYDNSALDEIALKTLNELSGNKYKYHFKDIPFSTRYNWVDDAEMDSADIYEDDFMENSHIFYCTTDDEYTVKVFDFTAPVICLGCGTINPEYPRYNAGNIICNSCSPKIYCDYCGKEVPEKDIREMPDGTKSCLDCLIDGVEAEFNPYAIDYCTKEIFEKEEEAWLDLEVAMDETISTGLYISILKKNLPKILKPEAKIRFDKYNHPYVYFDELSEAGIDAMWYPYQKMRDDNGIKEPLPRCDYEVVDKISFKISGEVGRYWLMLNL